MIEMLNIGVEKAVAYRISGKITDDDMTLVLTKIKEKIDSRGDVFLYQEVESIGGVELDAIIEKLKFLSDVGLSNFKKISVVTDKKWMQKVILLEDKIFKNIDMKSFSFEDRDRAVEFLEDA